LSNNGKVALREVISRAREQLRELTGRTAEAVTSVQRDDDGWILSVEIVEVPRIPDSTSILGLYEVEVDADGNLIEYSRTARYNRNQAGDADS
jgi:hypothetical protein